MFFEELSPLMKELLQQPVAFLGGFASGMLRLNLEEDPLKNWLEQQSGGTVTTPSETNTDQNGKGPQSIQID